MPAYSYTPGEVEGAVYTRDEVIWLKGMSLEDAQYASEGFRDSLAQGDGGSNAEDTMPITASWWDVARAARSIRRDKLAAEVFQLRTQGYAEEEIARLTGLTRSTVRRRFEGRLDDVLELLGGEYIEPPRMSRPAKCLNCGERTRVFLHATFTEQWVCIGERRDVDGKLCQAWQCRKEVYTRHRPIIRETVIGQVRAFTWVIEGSGAVPASEIEAGQRTARRLSLTRHEELPDDAFPPSHPWVKAWVRDTKAARAKRDVPERDWRVPTEVSDARRARQSSLCAECILPRYRPRIEQSRRRGRL